MNFFNRDIIRLLKILEPKKEELKRTFLFNKISYLEKQLNILQSIEKVTNFLITSPRYCYINLNFFQQNNNCIKIEPNIYQEYESIDQKVNYLKSYLSVIPEPFSKYEENVEFTRRLLSKAITLRISDSKCVQTSQEIDILRLFFESPNSPFHFTFVNSTAKDIDIQIKMMINCLLNFCQIVTKDDDLFDILYFLLIQFFFEIFYEKIELSPLKTDRPSQIVNDKLCSLKKLTLNEIGFGSNIIECGHLNSDELFDQNIQLKLLVGDLLNCHFLINPIEIFFVIRKIGIGLKKFFPNDGDLYDAWKSLFIASNVPSIDLIFNKLETWKDLHLISDLYQNVVEIPNRVINELIEVK